MNMRRQRIALGISLIAFFALLGTPAAATTIYGSLGPPGPGTTVIQAHGVSGGAAVFGVDFLTPLTDTNLVSVQLAEELLTGTALVYQLSLYDFDGTATVGSALWVSAPITLSALGFQTPPIQLIGLNLSSGGDYVMLSTATSGGTERWYDSGSNSFPGAGFVFELSSGGPIVEGWVGTNDPLIQLDFSPPGGGGGTDIPEPGTVWMLAPGALALLGLGIRRQHAQTR